MKSLRETGIGETARVVKIHGEGAIKRRIRDMPRRRTASGTSVSTAMESFRTMRRR